MKGISFNPWFVLAAVVLLLLSVWVGSALDTRLEELYGVALPAPGIEEVKR